MNTLGRPVKESKPLTNPLISKLADIKETSTTEASYYGIFTKCLFFLLMVAVGVAVAVYFSLTGAIYSNSLTDELTVQRLPLILVLASLVIAFIIPFIAFIIRATIPVTGSLFCMAYGYIFGFIAVLDAELGSYVLLALVLTIAVVVTMGILFVKGHINVNRKFRTITTALFGAMVTSSFLMFICSFIPMLRENIMALTSNPVIAIGGGIFGLVVAVLFMITDFDTIRSMVEDRMPKKYEWLASFSLMFTIVWVYLKILQLVIRIKDGD